MRPKKSTTPNRAFKVADQIQRDLTELIARELKDPRVGMVTIQAVEVTPDYAHAKVFFTRMGEAAEVEATAKALSHAAGFLRTELAHRIRLRTVPQLHFEYDVSVERGVRLSKLIDDAVGDSKSGGAK